MPRFTPTAGNAPLSVNGAGNGHSYSGDGLNGYTCLFTYLSRQSLQLCSHLLISGRLCRFTVLTAHVPVFVNKSPCHLGSANVNSQPPLQDYAPAYLMVFCALLSHGLFRGLVHHFAAHDGHMDPHLIVDHDQIGIFTGLNTSFFIRATGNGSRSE